VNRLAHERSPYLLQHASNPVEWYPWGDDAFARARAEDKPIFLSIGYSTCHWCHVMEHESFEDADVAAVLNEHYIAIKVDREERPDVDRVYMTFVQGTTGSGGWPMSVWLTPELKPFFGGTYFPPTPRWGRPGLSKFFSRSRRSTRGLEDRSVRGLGDRAAPGFRSRRGVGSRAVGEALPKIVGQFRSSDPQRRLRRRPEIPRPSELLFLLREHARTGDNDSLQMVLAPRAMAVGGMRDHIGGGFHRYSVDAAWRVPPRRCSTTRHSWSSQRRSGAGLRRSVRGRRGRHAALRDARDDRGRRRVYSAEDADSIPRTRERPRRTRWKAPTTVARGEIDELLDADAAPIVRTLRHRPRRECADRSAAGVRRQESAVHRPRRG
jgi:hypothetical protein